MPYLSPDNEYPLYAGDVRLRYPEWDDSKPLPDRWVYVELPEPPTSGPDEVVEEQLPVLQDGEWQRSWTTRLKTEEEKQHEKYVIEQIIKDHL